MNIHKKYRDRITLGSITTLFFILIIISCGDRNDPEVRILELFEEEKELMCKLELMKDSISSDWDNVGNMLNEKLPASTPEEEKNNMLKVRNADLIRMFASYDSLRREDQNVIDEAERKDMEMSKRILSMRKSLQVIENQRMTFFEQIKEKLGKEGVEKYNNLYQVAMDDPCS